ncbi:MAG: hypothetical protein LBL97_03855 [Prevotellaceae bacterium]|jgi:hypothetical protein|nr:hypothetical protein [Prevotellaceae bacterium]
MIKRLCTILLLAAAVAPSWAQQAGGGKERVVFAPRKGQWQVSLVLGGGGTFYNEHTSYLLPRYDNTQGAIGLPNGSTDVSGDLNAYLNISGLNNNSLVNIAGLQAKYFISDCWDINLSLGMNISVTPKRDFIEGDYESVPDMIVPAQKYVNAQMTNNWYATIGSNHYFKTSNPRILPYIGVAAGFQMARIETTEPYTGNLYDDDTTDDDEGLPTQVYYAAGKAGQLFGIRGAAIAGVEYSLAKGLILGLEFQPAAYRYDVIQICPKGFDQYNLSHHNIKVFDMPKITLGFRF